MVDIQTIGPEELKNIQALNLKIPGKIPVVPFTEEELKAKEKDYILVFGTSVFNDGTPVTVRNLKKRFGKDPAISEPCFYNQDWYDKEHFIDIPMEDGWFLIRKNVYEDSRAVQPTELMKEHAFLRQSHAPTRSLQHGTFAGSGCGSTTLFGAGTQTTTATGSTSGNTTISTALTKTASASTATWPCAPATAASTNVAQAPVAPALIPGPTDPPKGNDS